MSCKENKKSDDLNLDALEYICGGKIDVNLSQAIDWDKKNNTDFTNGDPTSTRTV